jgi:hypothetical protein
MSGSLSLTSLRGLNCPADELATVVEPTLALVAATDDEVVDAVAGVELENVPKDGAAADLDHGLRADRSFFGDTRAETAALVFDEHNSRELIERAGFAVHSVDRAFPFHLCLRATKVS